MLLDVDNGQRSADTSMDLGEVLDSAATPRPKQIPGMNPFIDTPKDSWRKPELPSSSELFDASKDIQEPRDLFEDDFQREGDSEDIDEGLTILTAQLDDISSMEEDDRGSQASVSTTISSFSPVHNLRTPSLPSSCVVSLVKRVSTSSFYVIKTFVKSAISYDTPALEHAMTEQTMLRLLTQMQTPFVLKLRWSFQDAESMRLVTDYCPGGDLKAYVNQSGPLHPSQAWLYAAELADTLCTLHSSGINHRSIHPGHILIDSDGHIVLTGFSQACVASGSSPRSISSAADSQGNLYDRSKNGLWAAPEVALGWNHDLSTDWWGFGCILGFMLSGCHPLIPGASLKLQENLPARVIESAILYAPVLPRGRVSDFEAWDLVSRCLERNPRMRAGADEAAGHQYFADLDWQLLRSTKYPVPAGCYRVGTQTESDRADVSLECLECLSAHDNDTLQGVHIAGFNYEGHVTDEAIVADPSAKTFVGVEDASVCSDEDDDFLRKPGTVDAESTYVTPAGSVMFDSLDIAKGSPRESSSTALYSCTSFGELREALKTHPAETFPLPSSRPVSAPTYDSGADFQSSAADFDFGRPRDPDKRNRPHSLTMYGYQDSRPTSILVRQDSDAWTQGTSTKVDYSGLGARGLGIRKYASLDFDLDTIVSLDDAHRSVSASRKISQSEGDIAHAEKPKPFRRVSFLDESTSPAGGQPIPTPVTTPASSSMLASPWKNFSKIYSPNTGGNANKLKKRRAESTPVFPTTPHLNAMAQEKVDLPPGLEQIGLGIGYKYNGPAPAPHKEPIKERLPEILSTPRRAAASIGPTIGLSRCTALFSGMRKTRVPAVDNLAVGTSDRLSEESDALDAVMREIGHADWDEELGFAGPTASAANMPSAMSSRRRAGRVYSVGSAVDVDALGGSTLRLIQDAASPRDELGR